MERIAIVGAGAMGTGLAVHCAGHGLTVSLIDHRTSNLERAVSDIVRIGELLDSEAAVDVDPTALVERVATTVDLKAGVSGAEFVLESVSERLSVKHEVFSSLVQSTGDDVVLATNTSGLSIDAIADGAPGGAARIIGCHWWNPPYLLRPVEVVPGVATDESTRRRTEAFVERVDRDPIRLDLNVPGFVWNRIQFAVIRECMHLAAEGVASVEAINRAIRDGYARRTAVIGPFETIDIAGLELFQDIAAGLYPELCSVETVHSLFQQNLDQDRSGIVDGAGFLDYDSAPAAIIESRDRRLLALNALLDS